MPRLHRNVITQHAASPYGLATISLGIFLAAWLFPPALYTEYATEPDLMYLDPQSMYLFLACLAAFCSGLLTYRVIFPPQLRISSVAVSRPLEFLAVPLLVATFACLGYLVIIGREIDFWGLLLSQQGNAIKAATHSGGDNTDGVWVHTLLWLTGTLWWAAFRARQLRPSRTAFRVVFTFGLVVDMLTCSAKVSRGALMPLVIGLACIYIYHGATSENVRSLRIALLGAGSGIALVLLFLLFSFFRGANSTRSFVITLLGYSIASYNRMAAILAGVMHYQYAGRGVYLFPVLVENTSLSNFMAGHFLIWQSEFLSVHAAGLNKAFIWSGVFGYVYSDLGWFAPLYIFFTGLVVAWFWSLFQRGQTLGIVIYPWLAYWILFWSGSNVILDFHVIELAVLPLSIGFYEFLFFRPAKVAVQDWVAPVS